MSAQAHARRGIIIRRALICVGVLLLVCAAFAFGYWYRSTTVSSHGYSSVSLTSSGSSSSSSAVSQNATEVATRLEEVQNILDSEAYTQTDVDSVTSAATAAIIAATGDKYGRYYSSGQYQDYLAKNTDEYAGIGVVLSEYQGSAYVARVFDDSPAALAGIQEGDFITSIDGETKVSWTLEDVTANIKRTAGSTVIVGWRRPATIFASGGETFTATIECATIQTPNVSYSLTAEGVGYISIAQFNNKTTDDVTAAVQALEGQGATSYLLDLRGNPGGYLMQAVDVVSMFQSTGTVVQVQSRTSGTTVKTVDTSRHLTDKPLVVLVNEDSAGASEIVASSLLESGRAQVIGTTTFGKGAAQAIKSLSYGGAIKYTIAYYLTPSGNSIEGVGITPSTVVAMQASLRSTDGDVQYSTAIANLQAQVEAAGTTSAAGTTTSTATSAEDSANTSSTAS